MDVQSDIRTGDTRAIARAITWIENADARGAALVHDIYRQTGRAYIVGITGSPGSGKSTLIARMAALLAAGGAKVGILAVDPSSPFSGGALLGDRIRMFDISLTHDVYMRSMGTRGSLGGLNRSTRMATRILDAAGFDWILIETVGAGQSEVDVHDVAYTTVVVLAPGMGDDIQAMKAGIMEIGDAFVINKADREGADRTLNQVESILHLSAAEGWNPPVLKVSAEQNAGVDELVAVIARHRVHLEEDGELDRIKVRMARLDVVEILKERLTDTMNTELERAATQAELEKVATRETDPYTVADMIVDKIWRGR
ncbi:MAG: methylmalonyl Co-A mutase-associated GTPase MeaB [Caldisericota bacterium]|nr:methylmalonyl Co-A mutase-associated GTPase MeaB [Caldisericota bacterium]